MDVVLAGRCHLTLAIASMITASYPGDEPPSMSFSSLRQVRYIYISPVMFYCKGGMTSSFLWYDAQHLLPLRFIIVRTTLTHG